MRAAALAGALALIALPSVARADATDDAVAKMDTEYGLAAHANTATEADADRVIAACQADPSTSDCVAIRTECGRGLARSGGVNAHVCTTLGWAGDTPSPFSADDLRAMVDACAQSSDEPLCQARGKICAVPQRYGFYLDDAIEVMCTGMVGDDTSPSVAALRDEVYPRRHHEQPQPGSIAALGYLQFGSATPSGAMSDGEWGFGIDYRAIPEIFPIGAELDITKADGSWHGRAGFHGGVGFEGSMLSGGVLIGFRRGGLVHDGYDIPGELLLFTRLGPIQVQLDAQAGFRFGDGVDKHFIGEGKLLVPLAGAHGKGNALFLGVHWATENGEQLTSFVIGGGFHQ